MSDDFARTVELLRDATTEIEGLRAENAKLRGALEEVKHGWSEVQYAMSALRRALANEETK